MIYLDHAATSLLKPECVAEAVKEAMLTMGNPGRGAHEAALAASRTVYLARRNLAEFFHMRDSKDAPAADRVVFTSNGTESLNIAIKGLVKPGDHVITTVMEHNSVLRPLYQMKEAGAELTVLPCDGLGRISCDELKQAVRPNTRAVVCTHASNLTGNVNEIGRIGDICSTHRLIFILDASQTAGHIDIDFEKNRISVLCFTGHKGLLGPQGTGGLCIAEGISIEPWKSGGSGMHSYEKKHPSTLPEALEAGTLNVHGIAGLHAAVSYLRQVGINRIGEKEKELAALFYDGIREIPGIRILGDTRVMAAEGDGLHIPIVSVVLGNLDSAVLADHLEQEYRIAVRAGAHCAPLMHQSLGTENTGAVRFCFSFENTREEAEAAAEALRQTAACFRGRVVSYVGAGGKTGSIRKAAAAYVRQGKKVLIVTTTKMAMEDVDGIPFVPYEAMDDKEFVEKVKCKLNKNSICAAGSPISGTNLSPKFTELPGPLLALLAYEADVVLAEADGAAHMAAKAPERFEPSLLPYTDEVAIVMGLHALGKPLKEVCHRKERVMELLSCGEEHVMEKSDLTSLMELGYQKPILEKYPHMKFQKIYYQKE